MIRTVVVLDNGVADGAGDAIALGPEAPASAVFHQPAWSTILSGGCEYGRIVADLFPEDSAVCFAAVEPVYKEVTGWKPLVYSKLLEAHRAVRPVVVTGGVASDDKLASLAAGLCKTLGTTPRYQRTLGGGWSRVLLLSSRLRHGDDAKRLGELMETAMQEWNQGTRSVDPGPTKTTVPIHHCELICAAVDAGGDAPSPSSKQVLSSPTVSVASHEVPSLDVVSFAQRTAQQVMNLRRIVVTGLDMKLPGGDMGSYDVSLFCAQPSEIPVADARGRGGKKAGDETAAAAAGDTDPGGDAIVLSKVTAIKQLKAKSGMLLPVSAAYRVTPIDAHDSATQCFVKYLLSGNSTCLSTEVRSGAGPKKKDKALSKIQCTHILREHSGALFVHVIDGSHTLVESLPTIEKCAGSGVAVTEYRVQPLTELLGKYTVKSTPPSGALPAKGRLAVDTEFFPLCRSDGIVFEYADFAPLVAAIVSDSMDWQAFDNCQSFLARLVEKRAANDDFCFEGIPRSHRAKMYARVFDEIALLARAHRRMSPNHDKLAARIDELFAPKEIAAGGDDGSTRVRARGKAKSSRRREADVWDEVDKIKRMSERERTDLNSGDQNNEHAAAPKQKRRKANDGTRVKQSSSAVADMIKEIRAFHADTARRVISLPMTLTSAERREAHVVADSLGLRHSSKGEGSERHLVLCKEPHPS